MTEQELQELSRKAAECLPVDFGFMTCEPTTYSRAGRSEIYDPATGGWKWLHESTEACAEIMVRVLWPADVDVVGNARLVGWSLPADDGLYGNLELGSDPLLAFRICVLRALVALKG